MKKLLLSLTIIIAGFYSTMAQFSFSSDGVELGDTVTVWVDPSSEQIFTYEVTVHNDTENNMNVKIAREFIHQLADNQFPFCWGGCYGPTTDTSSKYQFIPAMSQTADTSALLADYVPMGKIGTAIIKYTAFNMDSPDIQSSVVIKYWASPEGIAEDIMKDGQLSAIYPNPATNFVNLDYQLTSKVNIAQVKVFNMLGSVVKESILQKGGSKIKMDVSDLNNGVYFYSVLLNGNVYTTKKLVIRK